MTAPKPVLVGQAPGRRSDPLRPFSGSSGARLERHLGIAAGTLGDCFELRNLIDRYPGRKEGAKGDGWDAAAARDRARALRRELEGRAFVLAGRKVAAAFGVAETPYFVWARFDGTKTSYAVIPHPSGVDRVWNSPATAARLRDLVLGIVGRG